MSEIDKKSGDFVIRHGLLPTVSLNANKFVSFFASSESLHFFKCFH